MKGVARREFNIVAAWSVCRLGSDAPVLVSASCASSSRQIDLLTIAGPALRVRIGSCARAIAVVTDANVGAGHADAVNTCRKVACAFDLQ